MAINTTVDNDYNKFANDLLQHELNPQQVGGDQLYADWVAMFHDSTVNGGANPNEMAAATNALNNEMAGAAPALSALGEAAIADGATVLQPALSGPVVVNGVEMTPVHPGPPPPAMSGT